MQPYFPEQVMRLLYSHHDQVEALPPDAIWCASSAFCRYESFRIGNQVITFQGHPEFTVAYSHHLLVNCCDDVDLSVRVAALRSLERMKPQGSIAARFALDLLLDR